MDPKYAMPYILKIELSLAKTEEEKKAILRRFSDWNLTEEQ